MTPQQKSCIEKITISLKDVLRNFDYPGQRELAKKILAACIEELDGMPRTTTEPRTLKRFENEQERN